MPRVYVCTLALLAIARADRSVDVGGTLADWENVPGSARRRASASGCAGPSSYEAVLSAGLNAAYEYDTRPNAANPAYAGTTAPADQVRVQLYVTSISEFDEKAQTMQLAGYFRTVWTDWRLAFNDTSRGGCFDVVYATDVTRADIWRPDVYVDNALVVEYGAGMLEVAADGAIWLSRRVTMVTECHMYFGKMPFDEQECAITISTYSQDASQVALASKDMQGITMANLHSVEWKFVGATSRDEEREFGGDLAWTFAVQKIRLRRRPDFYFVNILIPDYFFVALSWCGYFVNQATAPARVAVAVIPVLITMSLNGAVLSALPRIAYPTWLCDILFVTLCFTFFACLEYGAVCYFLERKAAKERIAKTFPKMGKRIARAFADHAAAAAASAATAAPEQKLARDADAAELAFDGERAGLFEVPCFGTPASSQVRAPVDAERDAPGDAPLALHGPPVTAPSDDLLSNWPGDDEAHAIIDAVMFDNERRIIRGIVSGDALSAPELKMAMRELGKYWTDKQTLQAIANMTPAATDRKSSPATAFSRTKSGRHTSSLADVGTRLPRAKFIILACFPERYEPPEDHRAGNIKHWPDLHPAMFLDMLCRYTLLPAYTLVMMIYFSSVNSPRYTE